MSKELAEQFERDLSAPQKTAKRARRAREIGAELDVDWELVLEVYCAQANQEPKGSIRFPEREMGLPNPVVTSQETDDVLSNDDERYESVAPR